MSRTFTKLFSSITESTVWCEPDRTRLVWICMLAMADRHGRVWGSIPGLANRARVPVDDARAAIETFLSPDPDSRTPDFEGRRVEVIDGGWRLLNHDKYRAIRDEESIKESKRNYINTRRANERASVEDVEQSRTPSNPVVRGRANADADADAYTDTKKTKTERTAPASRLPADFAPDFQFAIEHGIQDTSEEFSKFRDYWTAQPGVKGRKLDWQATWRNWCRNARKDGIRSYGGPVTVPGRTGIDPSLEKIKADDKLAARPSAEIRARIKELTGARP